MKLGIYLTGPFGQSQQLYHARNEAKRGRATPEAVDRQIASDAKTVIDRQKELGFDYVSDPMLRFFYLLQAINENVGGIMVGPQENWFNNNVFGWRPIIDGEIDTTARGFTSKYLSEDLLPKEKI